MTVESAKGECNFGQHEIAIPLRRSADHRGQPRRLQDDGQGDRGPARPGDHLHGQVQRARGQLVPHPPVAARARRRGLLGEGDRRTGSTIFVAGLLATMREFTLLYAPNINSYKRFAPGTFAPTTVAWGRTTEPARSAWSGTAPAPGWRTGSRAVTSTRTWRWRPCWPEACTGSRRSSSSSPSCRQRLYLGRPARAAHPAGCAGRCSRSSAVARAAFGDDVVEHYANTADVEIAAFDAAVTDWELRRGFERM